MANYSSTFAGVRQAIVDDGAVGRAVYRASASDDPKPPCVVIADASPTAALLGDSEIIAQSRPLDVIVVQKNARDADPTLVRRVARAVHGLRFTVGGEPVSVRAGVVEPIDDEGYYVQQFTATAYQFTHTP